MKIIKLTAENVKRLKAVEITPDGTVQIITGRNAQGKTSVLDAIWLALGGGTAGRGTTRPIRDGEDKASVTLDLGDLTVTRTWSGDKTAVTVKAADGAKYTSPQAVLDGLVGRLSFDPLAFTKLSAREQVSALLDVVEIEADLDALARERQAAFDLRADLGRQGKAIGEVPPEQPDVPAEEVSASSLIDEITAATRDADRQRTERATAQHDQERVTALTAELAAATADAKVSKDAVEAHAPLPDVDALREQLSGVEATNRAVRSNAEIRQRKERKGSLRKEYEAETARIDRLDKARTDALAAAEFPVPGLAFDDSGVTYNGVPFSQASSAEQIRVSLAMAMALNPKLRVIRILDGSLLDADNLAAIAEMAEAQDYQVWIERVSDDADTAVVIEDGRVQS